MVDPQPDPLQYYTVTVTEGNCLATDYMTFEKVDSIVGIDGPALADASIYPNPNSGRLYIKADKLIHQLRIYDLAGRSVFSRENVAPLSAIDISKLQKGYYVVEIATDKGAQHLPLLIE